MKTDKIFIFHVCIPCGKAFSLEPGSRSSVKVKVQYKGHIFPGKKLKYIY